MQVEYNGILLSMNLTNGTFSIISKAMYVCNKCLIAERRRCSVQYTRNFSPQRSDPNSYFRCCTLTVHVNLREWVRQSMTSNIWPRELSTG